MPKPWDSPVSLAAAPIVFFTGKGGVGKTTVACQSAVTSADKGRRVLIVSTDPASNISEVLGSPVSDSEADLVRGHDTLYALNIDPTAAAKAYRERVIGPYRGILPQDALDSMEEQLSGGCTLEISAFDQFANILSNPSTKDFYDQIVFDTAPTGHTLRLLALASAWSGFFDSSTTGVSCMGSFETLEAERGRFAAALEILKDASRTSVVLVARPEPVAMIEAARASAELRELGISNQSLVINGVFHPTDPTDLIAVEIEADQVRALNDMPDSLRSLPSSEFLLSGKSPIGLAALREFPDLHIDVTGPSDVTQAPPSNALSFTELVEDLSSAGRGVVMTMGKGGVGKTTIATKIALDLLGRGHQVCLATTDPAAHLEFELGDERHGGLRVERIDPSIEVMAYRSEVMNTVGADLDEGGKTLLEEELNSPCTEEVAVFRAFARLVSLGERGFLVIDTAPTGHTLLLLDASKSFHREALAKGGTSEEFIDRLIPRLQDSDFTKVIIVTLPESTPVSEATTLVQDLRRADIEPYAWIANGCFALLDVSDPLLVARQRSEKRFLEMVAALSNRFVMLPYAIKGHS